MRNVIIALLMIAQVSSVLAAAKLSPQETAACQSDAIRNCFFSLGSAEATRNCLRKNITVLSPKCKALVEARMRSKQG
jgi:hypothetical protein